MLTPGFALQTSLFTIFSHSALNRRSTAFLFGGIKSSTSLLVGRVIVSFAAMCHLDVVSAVSCHCRLFGFFVLCFEDYRVVGCLASAATTASPFCRQRRCL